MAKKVPPSTETPKTQSKEPPPYPFAPEQTVAQTEKPVAQPKKLEPAQDKIRAENTPEYLLGVKSIEPKKPGEEDEEQQIVKKPLSTPKQLSKEEQKKLEEAKKLEEKIRKEVDLDKEILEEKLYIEYESIKEFENKQKFLEQQVREIVAIDDYLQKLPDSDALNLKTKMVMNSIRHDAVNRFNRITLPATKEDDRPFMQGDLFTHQIVAYKANLIELKAAGVDIPKSVIESAQKPITPQKPEPSQKSVTQNLAARAQGLQANKQALSSSAQDQLPPKMSAENEAQEAPMQDPLTYQRTAVLRRGTVLTRPETLGPPLVNPEPKTIEKTKTTLAQPKSDTSSLAPKSDTPQDFTPGGKTIVRRRIPPTSPPKTEPSIPPTSESDTSTPKPPVTSGDGTRTRVGKRRPQ